MKNGCGAEGTPLDCASMAHSTDDLNFRLPTTLRPHRYVAEVALDLEAKTFQGDERIELTLDAPGAELILHGTELELTQAQFEGSGKKLTPSVRAVAVSETLVLTFAEPLPAGEGTLTLSWRGKFSEGLRGLYLSGKVASTQFEAADARRLFPCFDEPAFKARWALTVRAPKGLTVLGNGQVVSDTEEADGTRKVTFAETELLSSYLIALVVGPLVGTAEAKVGDVAVRTWALAEKQHLLAFGQDAALNALPRLQDYFGLPYAFGKLDQVGIPDFEAGAMENAGLITYREVALLLDAKNAPLSVQKRVAETITHELAHQWFGNWVTMVWWDDLWLNEAFATWMAYKIVDGWKPHWRVWLDFDSGKAVALHLDALKSTHPIRGVVRNAAEAGESFDAITYEKGGAVLRMIEHFLGEHDFREGIRLYMRRHARANAVADDLWRALTESSSQPVLELANAWIHQSGYPVISVTREGRTVKLAQRRFYSQPGVSSGEHWPVPMVLRFEDAGGIHEQRVLFRERTATITLEGAGEVTWLTANAASTGFYRVAYDEAGALALAANLAKLAPSERIALLADLWALVRSGQAEIATFLSLASRFGAETDDAVLDELVGRLGYIESRLVEGEERKALQQFVEKLWSEQLVELGWDSGPEETDDTKLRRASIVRALGLVARSGPVLESARPRVEALLEKRPAALEPNLLDPSVALAARHGAEPLFNALLGAFKAEADPASKRRYLMSLAAFEDPALIVRAQGLLFDGTVPMQETAFFVGGLLANRVGQPSFWKKLRDQWEAVLDRTGYAPMILRRVIESLGQLHTRAQLEEVKAFLAAHPLNEVQQAVAQTLERLEQDAVLRERLLPDVATWLKTRRG